MDAALSYINSTLLNRIGRISLQDILEIHRRVLGFVDPIEAGQLRNTQVFVGDFIPPRPGEVHVRIICSNSVLLLCSFLAYRYEFIPNCVRHMQALV